MLTNEQRAHDFAISMLPIALTSNPLDDEFDENGNLVRDAFTTYLSLYEITLNSLNKVFVSE